MDVPEKHSAKITAMSLELEESEKYQIKKEQAGAELGQAQINLGCDFTLIALL